KSCTDPIDRAASWLRSAKAVTNEDRAMRLLGLFWAGAPKEDLQDAVRALIDRQQPDGGWGQLIALESDAYATGQALTALVLSGQMSVTDSVYRRGIAFLVRTQFADGSWLVRTRSFPVQRLKDSGFPHGKDQWISAAGTSWAAMALALALPL